jgi:hypothetical protein
LAIVFLLSTKYILQTLFFLLLSKTVIVIAKEFELRRMRSSFIPSNIRYYIDKKMKKAKKIDELLTVLR